MLRLPIFKPLRCLYNSRLYTNRWPRNGSSHYFGPARPIAGYGDSTPVNNSKGQINVGKQELKDKPPPQVVSEHQQNQQHSQQSKSSATGQQQEGKKDRNSAYPQPSAYKDSLNAAGRQNATKAQNEKHNAEMTNMKENIKEKVHDVKEGVKEKAHEMKEGAMDKVHAMKEGAKEKAQDVKEGVKEKLNEWTDGKKSTSERISDAYDKRVKDGVKAEDVKVKIDNSTYGREKLNGRHFGHEQIEKEAIANQAHESTMEKIKEMPHLIKEKVKDITGIGKKN